ncbi:MAG: hypothetical protein M3R59_02755 [Verrucomicrobiota bacterium]|nr:hypothetical protein [Verrucomicrobiota bacterium]
MKRFSSLLITALLTLGASATWAGPEAEAGIPVSNEAKNIARMNCGARLECITPDGRYAPVALTADGDSTAAALIMDDDTVSSPLKEGDTTFIISLPKAAMLDRFSFVNENAEARGDLHIAVSNYKLAADSPRWTEVEGRIPFSHKRLFNLSMLGVEAKYVKLTFHVQNEGRIAALALYSPRTIDDFAQRESKIIRAANPSPGTRTSDAINFDFANLYARAHVVFVSSGNKALAPRMIDDDAQTAFAFAPGDPNPTVIVELAEEQRLHRVSALYKMASGHLDVFLLDRIRDNPADLSGMTPIASVDDQDGKGSTAVTFQPRGARYVALRWHPRQADHDARDFEVAEISAFGDVPLTVLYSAAEAPDLFAANTIGVYPGEGGTDLSNSLGTLAAPPVVPPVSP